MRKMMADKALVSSSSHPDLDIFSSAENFPFSVQLPLSQKNYSS